MIHLKSSKDQCQFYEHSQAMNFLTMSSRIPQMVLQQIYLYNE